MVGYGGIWWDIVGYCGLWWDIVGYGGIWWDIVGYGGIWWDTVGYCRIWWDIVGYYCGIWWDMVGYGGVWWDIVGYGGRLWDMVGLANTIRKWPQEGLTHLLAEHTLEPNHDKEMGTEPWWHCRGFLCNFHGVSGGFRGFPGVSCARWMQTKSKTPRIFVR